MAINAGLWPHRSLWFAFVRRELQGRYLGSVGGVLWALLTPLLLLAIYGLVFRLIFRVTLPDLGEHDFIDFIAVALWPWLAFQEAVLKGLNAVQANAALVKKVAFPNELLVLSTVAATLLVHAVGYVLVLTILSLLGHSFHAAGWVAAPVFFLAVGILATAVTLPLAALQVFLRDIEQFASPLMMVVFYATPILYPLSMAPDWLQSVIRLNPLTNLLQPLRELLLTGHYDFGIAEIIVSALLPILLLAGLAFFRRLAPHFEVTL
jgi:ABC-type polysaccharide/polyol phosphate export permease